MLRSNNVGVSAVAYVSGTQRFNFHKRPLVASINDVPLHLEPPVVLDFNTSNINKVQQEQIIQTRVKDISIQTDYRDSEMQTDPYSPEEIFRQGQRPEVLMLKNLTYGHGLPASIEELDQIQLNREKQWFENSLPPTSDQASISLRGKLMQQQQVREWTKKENQKKKQNAEQLELVKKGLIQRQKQVEEKNAQRIEQIRIKNTEKKNREIAQIQRKRIKIFRKQLKAKKKEENDAPKRQIIEQYANFASPVYAGLTRQGLSLDKIANKHEIQPASLNTYDGLNQIAITDEVKPLKVQPEYTRLEISHKKALDVAQSQIQRKLKPQQTDDQVVSNDIQALRNVQARPSTPTWRYDENFNLVSFATDLNKADISKNSTSQKVVLRRQMAVLFLQRVLRGRAQQNFMYEGKEKRLALIQELLIVSTIPNLSQEQAEEKLLEEYDQKFKNALLEGLQGQVIAQTLDALSKELVRVKQQSKIAKLVKAAQDNRKQRQIKEAGNRNAEQIIRQREQHLYNQMVRMNQGTVDTYLDWIINNTVDKTSTRQATIMTNLRRTQMNAPLEGFERRFNNNETLIRDLVQSFLLPNIQRSKLKKKIELEQRRFQEAAKKSLQTTLTKTSTRIMQEKGGV